MAKKLPRIQGGFIVIPKNTLKSPEYIGMKAHTKAVFGAMLTEFIRNSDTNPDNAVKMTHKQMIYTSGTSHSSVVRAIQELKETNFIRTLIPGGLEGNPSTFQLNQRYIGCGGKKTFW